MKKAISKISLFFTLCILIISFTIDAAAVNTNVAATGDGSGTTGSCKWSYNSSTGTLTISGNGNMGDYLNFTPWHSIKYEIKTVIIYSGVTSIGQCAFQNCNNVASISIPNSIKKIGFSSFSGCKNLKSISIPENVTEIENGVFYSCTNLVDMKLPNKITSIWSQTFENCENLKSITIPKSVTSVGNNAFNGCASLKNIYYTGLKEDWSKISIGNNNAPLTTATINYGKMDQKITAKSYTKTYGAKAFNLKAKTSGDGKLTYKSSNTKIVKVSSKGKVTIKGCGKATVTIKATGTSLYKAATKKITIIVKPAKVKIKYFKGNRKILKIFYTKQTNADGYQCVYNRGSKSVKTTSTKNYVILRDLKKGICIASVRAYKKIDGKKVYGKHGRYQLTVG